MGFCLLTSGTSWNPASYGISANTSIHVKLVGGGGGGAGRADTPSDGSSTVFNSVTAIGGKGGAHISGTDYQVNSDFTEVQALGGCMPGIIFPSQTIGSISYNYGTKGGDGWYPGITHRFGPEVPTWFFPTVLATLSYSSSTTHTNLFSIATSQISGDKFRFFGNRLIYNNTATNTGCTYRASTNPYGNLGTTYSADAGFFRISGAGYGGAGCGASNYNAVMVGGNSGGIVDTEMLLSSTSAISYSIGAGGAGANYNYGTGGGGAQGCVAIWW